MRGFQLDSRGNVIIANNDIATIEGDELLRQTVQQVIGTNKGEWFLNEDEGIDFFVVLGKTPDEDRVRDELTIALQQVDETLTIKDFYMTTENRVLKVRFTAVNEKGVKIGGEADYGA